MNPRDHPNATAALSSGSVAAFLVFEAHARLGIDFNTPEQTMIIALVAFLYLLLGGKVKR